MNNANHNGNAVAYNNTKSAENAEAEVPEQEAFELRTLDASRMRVFRVAGVTRMTLRDERSWLKIQIMRSFPLSDPGHYLGFLDSAGKDIGLLHDPEPLDAESRRIVDEELEKRYFVPIIERVLHVKEEFGTVYWTVETDRGEKEIVVRNLRDNIQEVSGSRVIVTDADGNRFEFPDVSKLDGKSQGLIQRSL